MRPEYQTPGLPADPVPDRYPDHDQLTVLSVSNGFVVQGPHRGDLSPVYTSHVFRSAGEMADFLNGWGSKKHP